jgi:hypothetical protein
MHKLSPLTVLIALVTTASLLAKVKYGFGIAGFHNGN